MRKILILYMLMIPIIYISAQPNNDPDWQLMFHDDFSTFNDQYWTKIQYNTYTDPTSFILNMANNSQIVNGKLVCTVKNEDIISPSSVTPPNKLYRFTSGRVESKNNIFHYGYYEARIRTDFGPGNWPSFWLYNDAISNLPDSLDTIYSEIDIFEMVGNGVGQRFIEGTQRPDIAYSLNHVIYSNNMNADVMTSNVHGYYTAPGNINSNYESPDFLHFSTFGLSDYTNWHTYGFEWSPKRMIWYIDGIEVRHINTPIYFDNTIPMRVVLASGLSGEVYCNETWEGLLGNVGACLNHSIPPPQPYNASIEYDYFKYYKKISNCEQTNITGCYNFTTHTNNPKLSYNIGNGTCLMTVPNNHPYFMKALNSIQINPDFETTPNAEIMIDIDDYCNVTIAQDPFKCDINGLFYALCNFDFSIYNNRTKVLIEIGSTGCSTVILPSQNVKLLAKEYIKLGNDFSVPLNSTIELRITTCQ